MNKLLHVIITSGLFIALGTAIQLVIPNSFSGATYDAFVYFLTYIWYFDNIISANTLFTVFQILVNFEIAMMTFFLLFWIFETIAQD